MRPGEVLPRKFVQRRHVDSERVDLARSEVSKWDTNTPGETWKEVSKWNTNTPGETWKQSAGKSKGIYTRKFMLGESSDTQIADAFSYFICTFHALDPRSNK